MPTVVHVGPISSPGGIQSVIKTLTDHPPEGWDVRQIESHSDGSLYSKLKAYNSAKTELKELLESKDDVIVHLHSASDYSLHRKLRLAEFAFSLGGRIAEGKCRVRKVPPCWWMWSSALGGVTRSGDPKPVLALAPL